jgi:hypothetical protein
MQRYSYSLAQAELPLSCFDLQVALAEFAWTMTMKEEGQGSEDGEEDRRDEVL